MLNWMDMFIEDNMVKPVYIMYVAMGHVSVNTGVLGQLQYR